MENKSLLETLKKIQSDPSYINNLNSEELETILEFLSSKNSNENIDGNATNSYSKNVLTKSTPYYKGTETRTNNIFKKDGFSVIVVFSIVIIICTIVFMLIILNK